jgi:NAD(P)-dependent dehydrogenase (short-subunit alcohol dehydrogenase family)
VITGGGRGIGAATARALAEAGASVVVTARTREEIEEVAGRLAERGHAAHAVACDVSDPDSVREMSRAALERLGRVDILINNAGVAPSAPVARTSLEDWNRALAVNATGAFLCTRAFLEGMLERGWGRVINVASVAGLSGAPYIAAYAASKHALVGFTRCLAAEVNGKGVTANAVCPGYVNTDLTRQTIRRVVEKTGRTEEEALATILGMTNQTRLVEPEEVARRLLSLCPEEAGTTNGEAILIDEGGSAA